MDERIVRSLRLSLLGTSLIAGLALVGDGAEAGCLAPTDRVIDVSGTIGPLWGNEEGTLLYTRRPFAGAEESLVTRRLSGATEVVANGGQVNDFFVGGEREIWAGFHAGTLNDDDDAAFVASTTLPDDPDTFVNEGIPRRGVYARRSGSLERIARFGDESPVLGGGGQPLPFGSFFDAIPHDRDGGELIVTFSGDLGTPLSPDGRIGYFSWSDQTDVIRPILVEGDFVVTVGETVTSLGRLRGNARGDLAFFAGTKSDPQDDLEMESLGLFVRPEGATSVRTLFFQESGSPAPGGGTFRALHDFDLDDQGVIVFAATLRNAPAGSGLFRAAPPLYEPEALLFEGDATSLGGNLGRFSAAKVRVNSNGEAFVSLPFDDDTAFEALIRFDPDSTTPDELGNPRDLLGIATLGTGRIGYQNLEETRRIFVANPDVEGPTDFRLGKVDLKNLATFDADSIKFEGAFRLPSPGVDEGPAAFRTTGNRLVTPSGAFEGDDLTHVAEVTLQVSSGPGNTYVFELDRDGEAAGFSYNGRDEQGPRLKVDGTGRKAVWSGKYSAGRVKLILDLDRETFKLIVKRASLRESFDAVGFEIAFTLRTEADVLAGRQGGDAYFHYDAVFNASQPGLRNGRRVRSKGENPPGGLLFVDDLRVKRKLKTRKGVAAPDVEFDNVDVAGTIRLCAGATPPQTPTIRATIAVGDLLIEDVELKRRGKSGSRYGYKSAKGALPVVKITIDAERGDFKVKAKKATPIGGLPDADFSGADPENDPNEELHGISVPVTVRFTRVYEATYDVTVKRRRKAKIFER